MTVLHVVFRVAAAEYVIPASDVLQMESYAGATPVPGTSPFVAGIVQVRGKVVPVVDLRARFHLPAVAPTLGTRIVIVEVGDRRVGLVVDSAREVIRLTADQLKPPPRMIAERAEGFVKAVAQIGGRLLMLIDFSNVIGEEPLPS